MKTVCVLALACLAGAPVAAFAKPKAAPFTCASFMQDFTQAVLPHRATFERPLTITRGFAGDEAGIEVRVLSTGDAVEGTLKCKGDDFRRLEIRVGAPFSDKTEADFKVYQEGALVAAYHWDRPKVQTIIGAMGSDAAEYLRASVQRGDTFISGKVEYHQGNALDLGVIWTEADRTFVLTTQNDD
jgi:hypothetical protein